MFSFVKKILLTGNNDISTLQKSLYCIVKQALLPCKTGSFALQNNGYRNAKAFLLFPLCIIFTVSKLL